MKLAPEGYRDALAFSERQHAHPTQDWTGWCQQHVRVGYGIPAVYGSAQAAWDHAEIRHPHDREPLLGAPVFWRGGASRFGHVARYAGGGLIWSNDVKRRGKIDLVRLSAVELQWGQTYLGWTEDLNGYRLQLPSLLDAVTYDKRALPSATGGSGLLVGEVYTVGDTAKAVAAVNNFLHLGGATYSANTKRHVQAWQQLANTGGSSLRADGLTDTDTYHAMGRAAARRKSA